MPLELSYLFADLMKINYMKEINYKQICRTSFLSISREGEREERGGREEERGGEGDSLTMGFF